MKRSISILIWLARNRVVIPMSVNGSRELDILLDTGMTFAGVYLFHQEHADEINLVDPMEVLVPGAGSEEPSHALMADSLTLLAAGTEFHNQMVIVSQSERTQSFPTDGVTGYTLFGSHAAGSTTIGSPSTSTRPGGSRRTPPGRPFRSPCVRRSRLWTLWSMLTAARNCC